MRVRGNHFWLRHSSILFESSLCPLILSGLQKVVTNYFSNEFCAYTQLGLLLQVGFQERVQCKLKTENWGYYILSRYYLVQMNNSSEKCYVILNSLNNVLVIWDTRIDSSNAKTILTKCPTKKVNLKYLYIFPPATEIVIFVKYLRNFSFTKSV